MRVVMMESSTPKESWYELCERATKEQDPAKLLELIREINRILASEEAKRPGGDHSSPRAA